MTQERPGGAGSSPLWEREAELGSVRAAIDLLCTQTPRSVPSRPESPGGLLVFTGEPGVGKTALLDATRKAARDRGCAVWSARGGETLASVPFYVVRQLLKPALLSLSPEEYDRLGGWLDIAGPALGMTEPSGGHVDPQAVSDGLVGAVCDLTEISFPLVLLVDDAHWADQETLRWLVNLAQRLDELRILLVVTHRAVAPGREAAPALARVGALAGLRGVLHDLTPGAAAQLTRARLGSHADDAFCRQVWAVTAGNPYDTVELLAKVEDRGLEPVESSAEELRGLNRSARDGGLIARLSALGTATVELARAAAILGTNIAVPVAAGIAGIPVEEARGRAADLRTARIFAERPPNRPDEEDRLEFVHPLIASTVYQAIPVATRTALHGAAAGQLRKAQEPAAVVARHLLEVHPEEDPELVAQLRAAAGEHLGVGAPEAAVRCLERALREPPLPEHHAEVLYELGCATLLTAPTKTIAHLREALALPHFTGENRVDAVCRLAQALVHNGELEEAVRVIDGEVDLLPPGPHQLRLRALRFMWQGIHAGHQDSTRRSRSLKELADPLNGRDNSERALLIIRAFDALTRGENAAFVVELCDRSLVNGELPPGLGWTDTEWGFELLMMLGSSYLFADRLDRAGNLFNDARREYEDRGWTGAHLALAHCFGGYVLRRRGKLVPAEGLLREALRLADRVGTGLPMHWDAACMLIDTLIARGNIDGAMEVLEKYKVAPPYPSTFIMPDPDSVRGRLLIEAGRVPEGIEALEAAERAALASGRHNTVMATWAGDLARALAKEDPARAARLAAVCRAQAERFGTDTAIGEALRCAAVLATGQRSVTLHAQAAAYLEASPCGYEHAVARIEYGIAARSTAELERGTALARACGADTVAARGEEVLASWRRLRG
ncbi:ATP-binding protein [Streptomyces sp. LE64]|uniref:ATP-binding protein n=1 Tax=Streptomyces sp. LE64 TaxID=3448653 RepID=UPI00404210B5